MYTDYEFYVEIYGGSQIDEPEFTALELKAARYIDMLTANRLKNGWTVTDEVQSAVCAVAEVAKKCATYDTVQRFKSENNDGYSVVYNDGIKSSISNEMRDAATEYLAFTGLLYRGGVAW